MTQIVVWSSNKRLGSLQLKLDACKLSIKRRIHRLIHVPPCAQQFHHLLMPTLSVSGEGQWILTVDNVFAGRARRQLGKLARRGSKRASKRVPEFASCLWKVPPFADKLFNLCKPQT
ncbi:hypothetical protein OAM67_00145 [bacterium]|nr:hypothetical protein [bacterium]